jgi:hypothetical protein
MVASAFMLVQFITLIKFTASFVISAIEMASLNSI